MEKINVHYTKEILRQKRRKNEAKTINPYFRAPKSHVKNVINPFAHLRSIRCINKITLTCMDI